MTQPNSAIPSAGWPPPGLEQAHGKVWHAIGVLAFADIVLGLPLLATLATDAPYWSLGPFGDEWWLPIITTLAGGVMLVAGLGHLLALFRLATRAARDGHGWRTILYAATDRSRDAGFLLQRARGYATITPGERDTILMTRVTASLLVLAAVLMTPVGIAISVVLGRAGRADESLLISTAFIVPFVLLGAGAILALYGHWAGRRAVHGTTAPKVDQIGLVGAWNHALKSVDKPPAVGATTTRPFRVAFWTTVVLTILIVAPIITVVMVGAVAQILAASAMPSISGAQARIASIEPLRHYRTAPNAAISAKAAGEALNSLINATPDAAPANKAQHPPVHAYKDLWWPKDPLHDSLMADRGRLGATQLIARANRFTPAEKAYLAKVAAHPAHAEFKVVAGAKDVDVIGTRYVLPFDSTVNTWTLPIPRFMPVREGVRAHVAKAALELSQGHAAEAEATVREVISLGLVMRDRGPTILDNLLGVVIAREGGDALEALFRATGRAKDADELKSDRDQVTQTAERVMPRKAGSPVQASIEEGLRTMSLAVLDTLQPPGFRWEYFGIVHALAPCVSLKRLVFGPGESFSEWFEGAHRRLVHSEAEAQLFQLHQRGPFGAGRCVPPFWLVKAMRN